MELEKTEMEFELLGQKIRFRPDESDVQFNAFDVVSLVKKKVDSIKEQNEALGDEQLSLLVALELAKEVISLNKEYRNNINELELVASKALEHIEEISSSVNH